jgi:hypothetical protein
MNPMRCGEAKQHCRAIIVFVQHLKELLGICNPQGGSAHSRFPRWVPQSGCEKRASEGQNMVIWGDGIVGVRGPRCR